MNDHAAYRCTACDVNWPVALKFRACPHCNEDTWTARSEKPILAGDVDKTLARLRDAEILNQSVAQAQAEMRRIVEFYADPIPGVCTLCSSLTTRITTPDCNGPAFLCFRCDAPDPGATLDELGWGGEEVDDA